MMSIEKMKFILPILLISFAVKVNAATAFQVKVIGKGQPMILIPGLASSGDVWKSTVIHYSNQYECHVLTLAGFAGVPPIQSDWFLDQVKNEIIEYIKENHLQKPIIVGHSLGGFLALWIASTEPDLVGKIVIVDGLPFLPAAFYQNATPQTTAQFANQQRQKFLLQSDEQFAKAQKSNFRIYISDSSVADAVARDWGATSDKATVAECIYEMQTIDLRDEIEKIKVPVLVFASWIAYAPPETHEGIKETFDAQYAKLKNYHLVVTDTARNFVMLDDPQGFFHEIDQFLNNN